MPDTWLDDLIGADTGAAPTNQTHFPTPRLTHEQNQQFIIANAEIGNLTRKLQSRRKADIAAREATTAQIEAAKRRRDAVFVKPS